MLLLIDSKLVDADPFSTKLLHDAPIEISPEGVRITDCRRDQCLQVGMFVGIE